MLIHNASQGRIQLVQIVDTEEKRKANTEASHYK